MEPEIFVVSECCPVGCDFEVILLRARQRGGIFAYCHACGCTWSDPALARFERDLNEIAPLHVRACNGVEFPNRSEIVAAGIEQTILRTMAVSDGWRADIEQLNVEIGQEVTT